MPATLRFVLYILVVAVVGAVLGLLVQLITGQAGWWLVGMMAGAIVGALLGFTRVPAER